MAIRLCLIRTSAGASSKVQAIIPSMKIITEIVYSLLLNLKTLQLKSIERIKL